MERIPLLGRRLGRNIPDLLPHKNPNVLHLEDYYRVALPQLPPLLPYRDWMKPVTPKLGPTGYGMMLNNTLGDCTVAAVGHGIQILTGNTGNPVTPTDAQIAHMYSASGWNGTPATDNGWLIQDALTYWKNIGMAGHKILGYLSIDPTNAMMVDLAIELFGFVDIGIDLPVSAQSQNGGWFVPATGLDGDGAPGSWGGHSIIVPNRSPNLRKGITWGVPEWILSKNFWNAYVTECWCVLSVDWRSSKGNDPDGRIDWYQLEKDFQQF